MEAKKGDWVKIEKLVLRADQRADNLPVDTKEVPLLMWTKGFLLDERANLGDQVNIESYIGRRVEGKLVEINPYYDHSFGRDLPEIHYIGRQARQILKGGGQLD